MPKKARRVLLYTHIVQKETCAECSPPTPLQLVYRHGFRARVTRLLDAQGRPILIYDRNPIDGTGVVKPCYEVGMRCMTPSHQWTAAAPTTFRWQPYSKRNDGTRPDPSELPVGGMSFGVRLPVLGHPNGFIDFRSTGWNWGSPAGECLPPAVRCITCRRELMVLEFLTFGGIGPLP
jgi:hypothetical protein